MLPDQLVMSSMFKMTMPKQSHLTVVTPSPCMTRYHSWSALKTNMMDIVEVDDANIVFCQIVAALTL
eukprot:COSAG02_NODE_1_length_108762_cov_456.708287_51_plen_67_part_00